MPRWSFVIYNNQQDKSTSKWVSTTGTFNVHFRLFCVFDQSPLVTESLFSYSVLFLGEVDKFIAKYDMSYVSLAHLVKI